MNMSTEKINIEELRKAINILFDHIRAGGIDVVEFKKDYYWDMDADKIYNVAADPADLTIGSLFEDWESVQKIASNKDLPVVLLLLKVAPLLRYIGETLPESQLAKS